MKKKRHLEGKSLDKRVQLALGKQENMDTNHNVIFENIIERYRLMICQHHHGAHNTEMDFLGGTSFLESIEYIKNLLSDIDTNNPRNFKEGVKIRMRDSDSEDVESLLQSLSNEE